MQTIVEVSDDQFQSIVRKIQDLQEELQDNYEIAKYIEQIEEAIQDLGLAWQTDEGEEIKSVFNELYNGVDYNAFGGQLSLISSTGISYNKHTYDLRTGGY